MFKKKAPGAKLLEACRASDAALLQALVEKASPADLNHSENGVTPLVALCGAHDWPQIVSLMLELGAEIDDDNNSGHTAMMLASDKGHRRSVAVLKCAVMEQLIPHLESTDQETAVYAAAGLQNMSKDAGLARRALTLGAAKQLDRILGSSPSEQLRTFAAGALINMQAARKEAGGAELQLSAAARAAMDALAAASTARGKAPEAKRAPPAAPAAKTLGDANAAVGSPKKGAPAAAAASGKAPSAAAAGAGTGFHLKLPDATSSGASPGGGSGDGSLSARSDETDGSYHTAMSMMTASTAAASVPSAAGYAAGSSKGSSPTASGSPSRAPGGFRLPLRDPSRLGKDGDERSTSAKSGGSDENV